MEAISNPVTMTLYAWRGRGPWSGGTYISATRPMHCKHDDMPLGLKAGELIPPINSWMLDSMIFQNMSGVDIKEPGKLYELTITSQLYTQLRPNKPAPMFSDEDLSILEQLLETCRSTLDDKLFEGGGVSAMRLTLKEYDLSMQMLNKVRAIRQQCCQQPTPNCGSSPSGSAAATVNECSEPTPKKDKKPDA